ncbi:MAG TPA: flagellar basal body rod protein FlgB [Cerasibacillus sp.]|uniref:flagellar basal body rod protein FlgB n=1 Tax=Cerasibacillus sp. TaxID=2498711 RepID=UPI002F3E8D1C
MIYGKTFEALGKSLDYAIRRNDQIAANVANVDTPNYKAKDIAFKDILNEKLGSSLPAKRTHEKHLPFHTETHTYRTFKKKNLQYNHNGNNVDIDKEMANLAKNQIYYQGLVDRINGKFTDLQTVIRGGR